jgi:Flp pilus assembly pilin Flp
VRGNARRELFDRHESARSRGRVRFTPCSSRTVQLGAPFVVHSDRQKRKGDEPSDSANTDGPCGSSTRQLKKDYDMFLKKLLRNKRGAALVEYGLLVAGVALVTAAAVSIFGHKTNDMVSAIAAVLPGAHDDDNGPILSGHMIETTNTLGAGGNAIGIDVNSGNGIFDHNGTPRLGNNLGVSLNTLVVEP